MKKKPLEKYIVKSVLRELRDLKCVSEGQMNRIYNDYKNAKKEIS